MRSHLPSTILTRAVLADPDLCFLLRVDARVQKVEEDAVTVSIKDPKNPDSKPSIEVLPSGFTLWSTGIAMNPFTKTVVEKLPNQFHRKAVEVDQHLRVRGAPPGTIYAIGDASTVRLSAPPPPSPTIRLLFTSPSCSN